jgi:hypothetical protein
MPLSDAAASKIEKKSGKIGKVKEGDKTNTKKKKKKEKVPLSRGNKIQKQSLDHPINKSDKKSDKASRKKSSIGSSAVSGKVAEVVSPLILNYWNGRGLMEVPRLMLGKPVESATFCRLYLMIVLSICGEVSWRWVHRCSACAPSRRQFARR